MRERKDAALVVLAAVEAVVLIVSNLAAAKLWNLSGIAVDGGLLMFPVSYIMGDLTVEFYGKRVANKVVILAICLQVFTTLSLTAVSFLPPYPGWDGQEAIQAVFGANARIAAASIASYFASSRVNNWSFTRIREADPGGKFLRRALGSSFVARLVDSSIFETVAFFGVLPFREFLGQAIFAYLAGTILEIALSPVSSAVAERLRLYLNDDRP